MSIAKLNTKNLNPIDQTQLQALLEQIQANHHLCGRCQGLHLNEMEALEEVLEARLFCFADFLNLIVDIEIKPSAIFPFQALCGQLNQQLLACKIFLQIEDELLPKVVCCTNLANQDIGSAQLAHWLISSEQQIKELVKQLSEQQMIADQELLDDFFDEDDLSSPPDAFH